MILDPTFVAIYAVVGLVPPALLGLRLLRRRKICGDVLLDLPPVVPPGFLLKSELKRQGILIALLLLVSFWFEPALMRSLAAMFAIMAASSSLFHLIAQPRVTLCENGIWLGPMSALIKWKDIRSFERLPRDPSRLTLRTPQSRYCEPPIAAGHIEEFESVLEQQGIERRGDAVPETTHTDLVTAT